jgi:hypothetical protein
LIFLKIISSINTDTLMMRIFFDEISVAQFLPALFGHEPLLHAAAEVVLARLAAGRSVVVGVHQADHVLGVELLTLPVTVEGKTAFFRGRWVELFRSKYVRGH